MKCIACPRDEGHVGRCDVTIFVWCVLYPAFDDGMACDELISVHRSEEGARAAIERHKSAGNAWADRFVVTRYCIES